MRGREGPVGGGRGIGGVASNLPQEIIVGSALGHYLFLDLTRIVCTYTQWEENSEKGVKKHVVGKVLNTHSENWVKNR